MKKDITDNNRNINALVALVSLTLFMPLCAEKDTTPTDSTNPVDTNSVVTDTLLTVSPLPIDSVTAFVPLGNLNPSGHVFPTDHCYMYLPSDFGAPASHIVTFYCPGTLRLIEINAFEHVNANITDYRIRFELQAGVTLEFAHISVLRTTVFGDVTDFAGFTLLQEYTTGGETYRMWRKPTDTILSAGAILGTAGGNPGQWALDIGVYDTRVTHVTASAAETWSNSAYIHAVCPLAYYASGAVKDSLYAIVQRDDVPNDNYLCGWIAQDVAGTAQGIWFNPDSPRPYPEDPHLALVWHNREAAQQVISMGTSVPALPTGTYMFTPTTSGVLNRRFDLIETDGQVYGYHVTDHNVGQQKTAILQMTDSITLRFDALEGHISDSNLWTFTDSAVMFSR